MTYGYALRTAWIGDLDAGGSPAGYDLCVEHADRLGVPQGWQREDRRAPMSLFSRRAG